MSLSPLLKNNIVCFIGVPLIWGVFSFGAKKIKVVG
nr:MAG TPA: hypothetical protein [Caudoviricetes sp.]